MDKATSWIFPNKKPTNFLQLDRLTFFVGDKEHTVNVEELPPETTLNQYLRRNAGLTGTKNMCLEGGCGACIVAMTATDPFTEKDTVLAVNSCLVPIYSCSGWKIHTIESIGSPKSGYHPVQKALVQFNGTQCGFCSPGMLLNMFALYESGNFTMRDVDNRFAGNMCRCTGYRPILSAFKSLAADASPAILGTFVDIEDVPVCKMTQGGCRQLCAHPCRKQPHFYRIGPAKWYKVFSVNEVFDAIKVKAGAAWMLVGGNTAKGVYGRSTEPDIYIDLNGVKELVGYALKEDELILGANMTLTNSINLFSKLSKENARFRYLEKMAEHFDLIANVPVRNAGTLAGNIFTKHEHKEFPSDIFLVFEAVGAAVVIVDANRKEVKKSLADFLDFDMKNKLIKNFVLPALDESYKFESYKIMPRAQNAHALVNAAFLLKFKELKVERARIVYGGINPYFTRAKNSEKFLAGKEIFADETLQELFATLERELEPNVDPPESSPELRKKLAIGLLYKYILSVAPPDKISSRNKSGALKQVREVSTGTQEFGTQESMYPVTKPISKIEALAQCSGTAQYVMDIPDAPGQLHAAFVLAKAPPHSKIINVDASEALKMEGVVAYLDKSDVPGKNDFVPRDVFPAFFRKSEEVFCGGTVQYFFQPLGLIVASSDEMAQKAADVVQVTYKEGKERPLVGIRKILEKKATDRVKLEGKVEATAKGDDVKRVIKGTFDAYWQYHYTMETQCCAVIPVEDGLDMYPSSQFAALTQMAAAQALNLPINKINVTVRRLGGGYGSKITRNSLVSTAAAIAAYKLQKPVKLSLPLITNMNIIGKRNPFAADYEVAVDEKGAIQYLNADLYSDVGTKGSNENFAPLMLMDFGIGFKKDTWSFTVYSVESDTPNNTSCRAPATTEMMTCVSNIMEHISSELNLDLCTVYDANFDPKVEIAKYLKDLTVWADFEKRQKEVDDFNKANRWVKKGMSVVPMMYPLFPFGYWNSLVSIYQGDGTVAVAHAGIEMGQGINTKVAQVCAYSLGIPLGDVSIKPTTALVSPNAFFSGGSLTSEGACSATMRACEILIERMRPVKEQMENPTWKELVQKCYMAGIDLTATALYSSADIKPYAIFGATCAEVEVDILTGLYQAKRIDLLEDAGDSMSPQIDVGQVEGAFVMGLGYWTTEQIVFDEKGELLTNRTWNYKPPGAKDIPIDFRVKFPKNNPNAAGVLNSKATGEPALVMSSSVPFAIRKAVASARSEAESQSKWYTFDGPSSVENTFLNSSHDYKQYVL